MATTDSFNGTLTEAFDEAIKSVTQERGVDYDHPFDNFRRAHIIKLAVQDCPNPEVKHALEMIGVKLARLSYTPDHLDSIIDIAGYARTIVMILDKQKGQNDE